MGEVTEFPGKKPTQDNNDSDGKGRSTQLNSGRKPNLSLVFSFPQQPKPPQDASADDIAAYNRAVKQQLEELRAEHKAIDQALEAAEQAGPLARLDAKRFKKQKLALKDAITRLSAQVLPDIIA